MKFDLANLTPEARDAIVECLQIAARRGRQLREARERKQRAALAESLQNRGVDETEEQLPSENQQQKAAGDQPKQSDAPTERKD